MTTTVMEQAPALTLTEVDALIATWERQVLTYREDLARYELRLGEMTIAGGGANARRELAQLRDELAAAEQAVIVARSQREAVQRRELAEYAGKLRADAKELAEQAKADGAFVEEWGPKVATARDQMEHLMWRSVMMERQAEDIEYRLSQAVQA